MLRAPVTVGQVALGGCLDRVVAKEETRSACNQSLTELSQRPYSLYGVVK